MIIRTFAVSLIVGISVLLSSFYCAAATTGTYAQGPVPNGVIMVNQTTGDITQCVVLVGITSLAPIGKCIQIGTTPAASLSGNAQINSSGSSPLVVIMNLVTGYVTECEISNTFAGEPTGSCISASN